MMFIWSSVGDVNFHHFVKMIFTVELLFLHSKVVIFLFVLIIWPHFILVLVGLYWLHVDPWPICNLFLYMGWGVDLISFFLKWLAICSKTILLKFIVFPSNSRCHLSHMFHFLCAWVFWLSVLYLWNYLCTSTMLFRLLKFYGMS